MARGKRTFANITQLKSKRWQVRYTGPDMVRRYAPHTFEKRETAEAWVAAARRKIDKDQWDATDDSPKEAITFGVYAQRWLTNRQVAGRPIKARTREHYSAILDDHLLPTFGHRQLAAIKPKDVRDWYETALVDHPTMRSHAYSLLRTIFGVSSQRRAHRREPGAHRRRWPRETRTQDPTRVSRRARRAH